MGPGERPPQNGGRSLSLLPRLFLQLPLSSSHLNVYSGDPQVTASLVGVTSSSCPADLTQKRELTGTARCLRERPHPGCVSPAPPLPALLFCSPDAESRALAKERQKKDNHNLSESPLPLFLLSPGLAPKLPSDVQLLGRIPYMRP